MRKKIKGNKTKSLRLTLMLCFLIPMFLSIGVLSVYSSENMRKGMQEEFLNGLRDEAIALKASCKAIDAGDFYLNDNGELMKGNVNLTMSEDVMDSFTDGSDIAVTLFYGDTRKATTLISIDSGERMINTQASPEVAEKVLGGDEYSATKLVITKEPYMA